MPRLPRKESVKKVAAWMLLMAGWAPAERVWIGTEGTGKGIYVAELDEASGALKDLRLAAELAGAGFQVLHPTGKWLYSTCASPAGGGVAAFKVTGDGTLEMLGRQPAGGKGTCHVGIDAAGKVLMAANYGDGSICALPVKGDGTLEGGTGWVFHHIGKGPNAERQEGPHAHSVFAGPDDRFAYASDLGIDKVMIYRILRDAGKLEPAGAAVLPPGSGPRHLKFGKDGNFAYVLNELTLTVAVFARDAASGGLTLKSVVPVLPDGDSIEGMTCSEIRVSADGRFLYTANRDTVKRGRDSVSVMEIGTDGGVKRVQTHPAGVAVPRNIGLDLSGKWLLVCGQESNTLAVLAVNPADGRIKEGVVGTMPITMPMCVNFARD